MSAFVASGRIADLVIAVTLLEWLALAWLRRRTGRGIAPAALARALLPGLCLMLALRCALTGALWHWIAVWLLAAGLAHLADIVLRWRSS